MIIDCNITSNYLKKKKEMCLSFNKHCRSCPFAKEQTWSKGFCESVEMSNPGVAIDIVQKWSDKDSRYKWAINSDGYYLYCSDCGFEPEKISPYCPNCGKKMINFQELKERKND